MGRAVRIVSVGRDEQGGRSWKEAQPRPAAAPDLAPGRDPRVSDGKRVVRKPQRPVGEVSGCGRPRSSQGVVDRDQQGS